MRRVAKRERYRETEKRDRETEKGETEKKERGPMHWYVPVADTGLVSTVLKQVIYKICIIEVYIF